MSRARAIPVLAVTVVLIGCVENKAMGNDREASLDEPSPPAEIVDPTTALAGVAIHLLAPETMSEADQGALPDLDGPCRFRMTEVGFPVLVYGSSAAVKLNGRLTLVPGVEEGRYEGAGLEIRVRPLGEGDEWSRGEFVLQLPGAPHERGFHGFINC